jgi:hypothetical protein
MNYKTLLYIIILLLLAGCAAPKKPAATQEPKKLITKDDYKDLEIKPRKKKPIEVDYKKEGVFRPSIETIKK